MSVHESSGYGPLRQSVSVRWFFSAASGAHAFGMGCPWRTERQGKTVCWSPGDRVTSNKMGGVSGPSLRTLATDYAAHLWTGDVSVDGNRVAYRNLRAAEGVVIDAVFTVEAERLTLELTQKCAQSVPVIEAEAWRFAWNLKAGNYRSGRDAHACRGTQRRRSSARSDHERSWRVPFVPPPGLGHGPTASRKLPLPKLRDGRIRDRHASRPRCVSGRSRRNPPCDLPTGRHKPRAAQ